MLVNACKESQGREPILTPINLVEPWPWNGFPQILTGWGVVAATRVKMPIRLSLQVQVEGMNTTVHETSLDYFCSVCNP